MAARDVRVGDRLLSAAADGGSQAEVRVVATALLEADLFRVLHAAGSLVCSDSHPLMVRRAAGLVAVAAPDLAAGDRLVLADLSEASVRSSVRAGRGFVARIGTDGSHLYFAGDAPVLGHNKIYYDYTTADEI